MNYVIIWLTKVTGTTPFRRGCLTWVIFIFIIADFFSLSCEGQLNILQATQDVPPQYGLWSSNLPHSLQIWLLQSQQSPLLKPHLEQLLDQFALQWVLFLLLDVVKYLRNRDFAILIVKWFVVIFPGKKKECCGFSGNPCCFNWTPLFACNVPFIFL